MEDMAYLAVCAAYRGLPRRIAVRFEDRHVCKQTTKVRPKSPWVGNKERGEPHTINRGKLTLIRLLDPNEVLGCDDHRALDPLGDRKE